MLALFRRRSPSHDDAAQRSVEAVLEAAANRIGMPKKAASVALALRNHGVFYAWQLAQASDSNWNQLNVDIGLQMAVRAELADPTSSTVARAIKVHANADEMPERLRRFLLIPGDDGKEAERLGSVSALYLGLLIVNPDDRQHLALVLFELLALVSGLFVSLPLSFLRDSPAVAAESDASLWQLPPTLEDGVDFFAFVVFFSLAFVAYLSVLLALVVAAGGWKGDVRFYEAVGDVTGFLFFFFALVGFIPLCVLVFWRLFNLARSPYMVIGAIGVTQILQLVTNHFSLKFMVQALPLEIYHTPRWFREQCKNVMGPLLRGMLSDDALRPAAERRAAELRARYSSWQSLAA